MPSPLMNSLGLDKLSPQEKLNLVHELWESLSTGDLPSRLSMIQRKELNRRSAEDESSPDNVISWEDLKAKLLPDN